MIRIMANENMEEWGANFAVELETIRAVVEAFGAGKIKLPHGKFNPSKTRYAPNFVLGDDRSPAIDKRYNGSTISNFLG
ncbi:MAG: hypothetical protein O7B81_05360 [Gammaproteobacteria bacterium]|nr:hypothetical protein [Gammaproteobacteria bacterium]